MKIFLTVLIIIVVILLIVVFNINEKLRNYENENEKLKNEAKQDYHNYHRELMLHHKLFDCWEKYRYGIEFDGIHSDYEGEYYRLCTMERLVDDICNELEDFKYLRDNQEDFENYKKAKKVWEEGEKELEALRKK